MNDIIRHVSILWPVLAEAHQKQAGGRNSEPEALRRWMLSEAKGGRRSSISEMRTYCIEVFAGLFFLN